MITQLGRERIANSNAERQAATDMEDTVVSHVTTTMTKKQLCNYAERLEAMADHLMRAAQAARLAK